MDRAALRRRHHLIDQVVHRQALAAFGGLGKIDRRGRDVVPVRLRPLLVGLGKNHARAVVDSSKIAPSRRMVETEAAGFETIARPARRRSTRLLQPRRLGQLCRQTSFQPGRWPRRATRRQQQTKQQRSRPPCQPVRTRLPLSPSSPAHRRPQAAAVFFIAAIDPPPGGHGQRSLRILRQVITLAVRRKISRLHVRAVLPSRHRRSAPRRRHSGARISAEAQR